MAPSRPPPVEPHRCSFLLNAIKNTDDKRRAILGKRMKTTASSRKVSHPCVGQTADSEELSLADQRTRETCSGRQEDSFKCISIRVVRILEAFQS